MRFFVQILWSAILAGTSMAQAESFDHSHATWSKILSQFVVIEGAASQVHYLKLKKDQVALNGYLSSLSKVSKKEFDGWSKPQQMAFLINAYNAFTVKLVIDHYPVSSIKKIGGWFGNPWKIKFFKLLGEDYYLDRIEHEQLRPVYKDARVHFAVNCASIGCPRLRPEAYSADQLESQLDDQAKIFLADQSRNQVDKKSKTLYLSKIFDWFKEDFKPSPAAFVAPYLSADDKGATSFGQYKTKFLDYDWNLNDAIRIGR